MRKFALTHGALFTIILLVGCKQWKEASDVAVVVESIPDPYTIVGEKSFLDGYEPVNADGSINVVVEIPAGTTEKWEVNKPEGQLKWQFQDGAPRIVKYLGYPGNYGMIPRTLLPKERGGDGDPLDVVVLGPAVERGDVVRAKLIGVLKLLDGGEQDDKLLAVMENTALFEVNNLSDLDLKFPGTTTIMEAWFANYKGPGAMATLGFRDVDSARAVLDTAIKAFQESQATH